MTAAILLFWLTAGLDRKAEPPKPPESAAAAKPAPVALLGVRRIFVDRLTGGTTAAQLRDLIISALDGAKLFVITESEEHADAILRGAAEDLVFTDKFSSNEGAGSRSNTGQKQHTTKGVVSGGQYGGLGMNDYESTHIEERKHEAMASVRLVNKDGDVIWSTTQESLGGKFRGASADVAERIAKQLAADLERARKAPRLP